MFFRARTRTRIDRRPARRVAARPRLEALETRLAPAAATHLAILTSLRTVTAGEPFELDIEAEDDSGNVDTTYSASATISLAANPGNSTLGGLTFSTLNMSNGVVSFSGMTLNQPGSGYELQVTSGSLPVAKTNLFNVTGANTAATQLKIMYLPPPTLVAGQTFGLTVVALAVDGSTIDTTYSGTVVLALAGGPVGTTMDGNATASMSKGVANISGLTLNKSSSNYQIQVSSGNLIPATTPVFTVTAAVPTQLVVTSQPPAIVTAGQMFGLTATVEDQYSNTVTGYIGNIAVAPTDTALDGNLGGVLTAAVSNGQAQFSGLSLVKAGTPFTLQVSTTGLSPATTSPFSVTVGTRYQLGVVSPPPTSVGAGVGFGLVLAAEDRYGNVVSSYSGDVTVALASNPGYGQLAGNLTEQASGGLATFSGLTLVKAASSYVLQASADDNDIPNSPSPSYLTLSVTAGAPSQLELKSAPPSTVTAGTPFTVVLAAEDQYGNTVSSLAGNVSLALASNPGGGALGGTTSVPFNAGLATFQLTLTRVGAGYSFTASSSNMTPTPAITNLQVNVIPAPASQLVVTIGPPVAVTTGQTFGLTVTAEDPYGNTATSFNGNVAVAPSNNGIMGNLGGPLTAKASGGVADFSGLSLSKSGSPFTLQATSTGLPLAVTSPFTVSTGQATELVVIAAPSTVAVGTGFGLQVAAEDPYGNIDGSFGGTVNLSLASNPAGANLGGAVSATAVNGVATFSGLTLDALGSGETLLAKTTGLASVTTGSIAVAASGGTNTGGGSSPGGGNSDGGGATTGGDTTGGGSSGSPSASSGSPVPGPHLVISNQPATVTAGRYFQITLMVEDAQDRVETNFTGKVTVALANNPTGAVLGGNLTMPVQHGLLTFYGLTLNAAGSGYTIRAGADGFNSAVSSPITVVDPPSAVGVVGPPPSSVAVHQAFGLTVAVEGVSGSLVPDYSGKVTIALVGKRRGATLRGPRTVQAVGGVAQFSRLSLSGARKGSAVLLRITADGVGNAATVVLSIPTATRSHHAGRGTPRR